MAIACAPDATLLSPTAIACAPEAVPLSPKAMAPTLLDVDLRPIAMALAPLATDSPAIATAFLPDDLAPAELLPPMATELSPLAWVLLVKLSCPEPMATAYFSRVIVKSGVWHSGRFLC